MKFMFTTKHSIGFAILLALDLTAGILIGWFSAQLEADEQLLLSSVKDLTRDRYKEDQAVHQQILDAINPSNIRENLRELSRKPHMAGTPRDDELAYMIRDKWIESGLDSVELVPYDILLSFPKRHQPNKVRLLNANGVPIFESRHEEIILREEDHDPDFVPAFNAYSPNGTVQGLYIYVNYGREEDFKTLESIGVVVAGKICIIRHGKIFRGNKVQSAAQRGAIGVVLFSDPADVALNGTNASANYPESFWLPGTGMQRGSLSLSEGDPLTPGWPATDGVYRLAIEDAKIHAIPSQPIGYDDARELLNHLAGPPPPSADWKGGILELAYNIGPAQRQSPALNLKLEVNNELNVTRSFNVIGRIRGAIESDRYVLIGNHRDAWGYGAVDPSSGTAGQLEIVRVVGDMLKKGWRPRRTWVFCSWGAEEFATIGSQEWVEDKLPQLMQRSVAYINVDICPSGPMFEPAASPLIADLVLETTKKVSSPYESGKTYHDFWSNLLAQGPTEKLPSVDLLASGSDHAPFAFFAGIPSTDIGMNRDKIKYDISIYPTYHTGYETFYLMDTHIDPGFKLHRTCSQIVSELALRLSESTLLPFNVSHYAHVMLDLLDDMKVSGQDRKIKATGANFDGLYDEIKKFRTEARKWQRELPNVDVSNPLLVRQINDQLMSMERAFILPKGLPGRWDTRHGVFASNLQDTYASAAFPGLTDYLSVDGQQGLNPDNNTHLLENHVSDLIVMARQATALLQPPELI